jgi:hypothetical protein
MLTIGSISEIPQQARNDKEKSLGMIIINAWNKIIKGGFIESAEKN